MTSSAPVPSDLEAESIIDLVHDCREVSGVLGSLVPTTVRLPEPRGAVRAVPFGVQPVQISLAAVDVLAGYDEYGS